MKKFSSISKSSNITSIAIGKFDSMHLAHKAILDNLDKNGIVLLIKMPHVSNGFIVPYSKRDNYIQNDVYYINFDEISDLSGVDFLYFLKSKLPYLKHIIVGSDFKFGKNRSCNAIDIQNLSDLNTTIIDEMSLNGIPIHSSYIKQYILSGDIALANQLLGRFYSIEGRLIKGQGIGKEMLFPTINIQVDEYILPKDGVYASYVKLEEIFFKSISFLGNRLSTDNRFAIETHIIDNNIHITPDIIEIFFVERIRDNMQFDNLISLKTQINNDINIARNILETQKLSQIV